MISEPWEKTETEDEIVAKNCNIRFAPLDFLLQSTDMISQEVNDALKRRHQTVLN